MYIPVSTTVNPAAACHVTQGQHMEISRRQRAHRDRPEKSDLRGLVHLPSTTYIHTYNLKEKLTPKQPVLNKKTYKYRYMHSCIHTLTKLHSFLLKLTYIHTYVHIYCIYTY